MYIVMCVMDMYPYVYVGMCVVCDVDVCMYVCVKCVAGGMYNTSLGDQPIPGQQHHYHHYMLLYTKTSPVSCPYRVYTHREIST